MSTQRENVIPFIVDDKEIPIESELALIVGIVGDKIKKSGIFKRSKERFTQVSKFYWRLQVDTLNDRVILVDSLGLYGGGTSVQDLTLSNILARLKAIQDATTAKAYTENLREANQALIIGPQIYPLFDQSFTRSTFDLVKKYVSEDVIDTPLILPTFEQNVSNDLITLLNEVPTFVETKDRLREIAQDWLAEINAKINEIERTFAGKLQNLQEDVNKRIDQHQEKMEKNIDTELEKANQAAFRELSKFESSTLGLTGMINPIQEQARKILSDVPSIETPKFQNNMKTFLENSRSQIEGINTEIKDLENDRKNLAKNLNSITQQFMTNKQNAIDDYENKKTKALNEIDELRMDRDRNLSNLVEMRDGINRNTSELCKKIDEVVANRKAAISKSAIQGIGNIPADILISLFLIKFQDKDDVRYFVIPPLCKPRTGSKIDYPNAERDSAIIGGKQAADKIAEELVFNRRLKSSFDALRATNYLATGEFRGAVMQGLDYLAEKNLISKKGYRKIIELLENIDL
ncbi:MAG: hypothetical protein JXA54_04910 [Candidatus Heimdallarchaeota archaeon]|nr:hypothetical protein [Candidatus Heimdallarchaeota archaeon]